MKKKQARVFALALVLILCVCTLAIPASAAKNDFPTVLANAKKGVIQIYGLAYDHRNNPTANWTGSGFAIGKAGEDSQIFLTNQHVALDDYDKDHVRLWIMFENCTVSSIDYLPDPDRSAELEIVSTTTGYPDYAIVRAKSKVRGYKALPLLSSKDIPDGTTVYALGFPGDMDMVKNTNSGIDDITVTNGIVSQHMQFAPAENTWVLLNTAKISHGNSGGPLITEDGAVVGLNTYGLNVDGERYMAVYIDYAMEALDKKNISYDIFGQKSSASGFDIPLPLVLMGAGVAIFALILFMVLRKKKDPVPVAAMQPAPVMPAAPPVQPIPPVAPAASYSVRIPGGSVVPIGSAVVTVGRDPSCTLRLPPDSTAVSRKHCTLEVIQGTLVLTDIGSSNGTFIHGNRIPANTKVALKHGSSFCLGSKENTFTVC